MNYVTQLRRLQQDGTGSSSGSSNSDTFDSKYSDTNVFLYVNIIIVIILLFSIVFYCYIFRSRIDIFLRRQIDINEMNLEQNIRDRQQRRIDAAAEAALATSTQNATQTSSTINDEEESAESRRARLLESFQRNKVTMVVTKDDFSNEISEHMTIEELNERITTEYLPDTNAAIATDSVEHEHVKALDSAENSEKLGPSNTNIDIAGSRASNSNVEDGETRHLCIGNGESETRQLVPNCCAICLCPYEIDDTVVWNCRKLCKHAFHLDCMVDWLTKMRDGTPCPCCRQEFTDIPIIQRRKVPQQQSRSRNVHDMTQFRTFDLSALSFR